MKTKYDVIVIGSGIGGLTAASLLSKDRKVLVLEKNSVFGGYCSTFRRRGFKFESAVQSINGLYEGSPIYSVLKKSQALTGVKIIRPKHLYRSIFPDHDIRIPQANIAQYTKILASIFPKEKNNITKFFGTLTFIYLEMDRFYTDKPYKKSPYILKYGRRSLRELMNEFISNKQLQSIIAQYWMYRGLPPSRFSAITFAYIWYDYTVNGSYFPDGGMDGIIDNLIRSIRKNNSDVVHDSEAIKLIADGNIIKAIELNNGKRYEADIFISNIDLFRTFGIISGGDVDVVSSFLHKLEEDSLSISAFKIYLGLDFDVKKIGITDYEIFVNPSYDMESMYQSSIDNEFKKAPYSVTVYSNLSDKFCKSGNSVISITSLAGYDHWHNMTELEYAQKKQEAAEILLLRCEKLIPGLRKSIKEKVVATPLTMERHTGNSSGSIYGWNKKSLIHEIRFINPTTPIKNLLLSSHWTKMGGGVGGVLLSSGRVNSLIKNKEYQAA